MADEQLVIAATATVRARLDQLVSELGRPEPATMASEAFLGRLDTAIRDILVAGDATARDDAAHQLAGSAETLGALSLGAAAREVMRLAREEPSAPLPDDLADRLRAEAAAAEVALRAEVARLEAG